MILLLHDSDLWWLEHRQHLAAREWWSYVEARLWIEFRDVEGMAEAEPWGESWHRGGIGEHRGMVQLMLPSRSDEGHKRLIEALEAGTVVAQGRRYGQSVIDLPRGFWNLGRPTAFHDSRVMAYDDGPPGREMWFSDVEFSVPTLKAAFPSLADLDAAKKAQRIADDQAARAAAIDYAPKPWARRDTETKSDWLGRTELLQEAIRRAIEDTRTPKRALKHYVADIAQEEGWSGGADNWAAIGRSIKLYFDKVDPR